MAKGAFTANEHKWQLDGGFMTYIYNTRVLAKDIANLPAIKGFTSRDKKSSTIKIVHNVSITDKEEWLRSSSKDAYRHIFCSSIVVLAYEIKERFTQPMQLV